MVDFTLSRRLAPVALVAVCAALPVQAQAQSAVRLDSNVTVERVTTAADGTTSSSWEKPVTVVPGDKLRFTIRATNGGNKPAEALVINNPIPRAVAFTSTPDLQNFVVSIDGGKSWGALEALTITDAVTQLQRPATPDDVTNVKWQVPQAVAPGQSFAVTFYGRVR